MTTQLQVRVSYKNTVETYNTKVIGIVNLLETFQHTSGGKAIVNVTTDKCNENHEWHWGYHEN